MKNSKPAQFYVYTHAKPDGTVFYVGKGNGRRARRIARKNKHHRDIVSKYGADNIIVATFPVESEAAAFALEIKMIADFRADGHVLANVTPGGEGTSGLAIPEERKVAIGAFFRGRPISDAHKAKIGNAKRGIPCLDNVKAAVSAANTGRKWTAEQRSAASAAGKGRAYTAERNAKVSAANIGKKRSPEHCEAVSLGRMYQIANKPATQIACHHCGEQFDTKLPTMAKFCGRSCACKSFRSGRAKAA